MKAKVIQRTSKRLQKKSTILAQTQAKTKHKQTKSANAPNLQAQSLQQQTKGYVNLKKTKVTSVTRKKAKVTATATLTATTRTTPRICCHQQRPRPRAEGT